jgi:hypothetical protein
MATNTTRTAETECLKNEIQRRKNELASVSHRLLHANIEITVLRTYAREQKTNFDALCSYLKSTGVDF